MKHKTALLALYIDADLYQNMNCVVLMLLYSAEQHKAAEQVSCSCEMICFRIKFLLIYR